MTSNLDRNGFEIVPAILAGRECEAIKNLAASSLARSAGSRQFLEYGWCWDLAEKLRHHPLLRHLIGPTHVTVQCTYFDKSLLTNWLVAYHQDLSIPVLAHVPSPACTGWAVKDGVTFVQPPLAVLQSLVAVRLHLDRSEDDNGPLRVLSGSHALGRVSAADLPRIRAQHQEETCTVPAGGILALKPLLLHASSKALSVAPRRVLHFVYGPSQLPEGLAWRRLGPKQGPLDAPNSTVSPLRPRRSQI